MAIKFKQINTTITGTVELNSNGTHNVKDFEFASVNVPNNGYLEPSGETYIYSNGTHNVKDVEYAVVEVDGYPEPSGYQYIYSNGEHHVKDAEYVMVEVPGPSEYGYINSNGEHFVRDMEYVMVEVPGIIPQGEKEIYASGSYDVTEYATVKVDIPTEGTYLKPILDSTKRADRLFMNASGDISGLIQYDDTENVESFEATFTNCAKPPIINTKKGRHFPGFLESSGVKDVSGYDFSLAENLGAAFNFCYDLQQVSLPHLPYVENMGCICGSCTNLIEADIDFSNANSCYGAFRYCNNLKKVSPIRFKKGQDTYISEFFAECFQIENVDLSYFKTTEEYYTSRLFSNSYQLKEVVIREIDPNNHILSSDAIQGCDKLLNNDENGNRLGHIYVPRDMIEVLQNETTWCELSLKPLVDYDKILQINNQRIDINTTQTITTELGDFTSIPTVTVTADNENLVSISNVVVSTDSLSFDVSAFDSVGETNITINVSGDHNKTISFKCKVALPFIEPTTTITTVYGDEFILNDGGAYDLTGQTVDSVLRIDINNINEDDNCRLLIETDVDTTQESWAPHGNYVVISNLNQSLVHSTGYYQEDVDNAKYTSHNQHGPQHTAVEYILPKGESFIEIKVAKWAANDIIKLKPIFEAI